MHPSTPLLIAALSLPAPATPLGSSTPPAPSEPRLPSLNSADLLPELADHIYFDEPGDGALWVLGGTRYKARFTPEGVTCFPFVGPTAPRSEPLTFTLRSAHIGDHELPLAPASPERAGDYVIYERGTLVEYYELRPRSMEQLFRLDHPPGPGDLVLRIAISTDLSLTETPAGFRFTGEHGGATFSRAIAYDARGVHGAIQTSWHPGELEIRLAADFLSTADYPITIDPVIETFAITATPDESFHHADVAYDASTDRFAVVYSREYSATDHDVVSVLYTSDGDPVPGSIAWADVSSACWREPAIANSYFAADFLVVATTSPDCGWITLVEGRKRQAANATQGPQFLISPDISAHRTDPDVGGNSSDNPASNYCVVYESTIAGPGYNVKYQIVLPDSTLLFDMDQHIETDTSTDDKLPSISNVCGNGPTVHQDWNLVWQRGVAAGERDIMGARIHWNGQISSPPFVIDTSAADDLRPAVSSTLGEFNGQRPYLVTFQRGASPNGDIYGVVLSENDILFPATNLSALEGGAQLGQDQNQAAVDCDGLNFAVAYSERFFDDPANYNVFVSTFRLAAGGLIPVESHESVSTSFEDDRWHSISAMHGPLDWSPNQPGRFMLTWERKNPLVDTWHIEGALLDAEPAAGVALCFGDGQGFPCPCGNDGTSNAGCANTSGQGCALSVIGSNSISAGDLELVVRDALPGQPGMFFQGNVTFNNGEGISFGDGLRCCGQGIVRLEVVLPDGAGGASTSVDVPDEGGVGAGESRCYQFWYRDPSGGGACGNGFNLSNAYEVFWAQ